MLKRWLGIVVSSSEITIVDAEVPTQGELVVQGDHSWPLQTGDRAKAYGVLYQQLADYVEENEIKRVIVKESALSRGGTKKAHLHAAEVRGVVIAAAAACSEVRTISKAAMSNNYGARKVDEYVKDNTFWENEVSGAKLRNGSREAAFLLLAARKL